MIDLVVNGEMDEFWKLLTPVVYGYLGGWIVLFIIGAVVQYKLRSDQKQKEELDENDRFYLMKK
jgi:hypothetical protein